MASYGEKKQLDVDLSGLDPDAQKRVRAAVEKAGMTLGASTYSGGLVRPAEQGEIETSLEFSTADLDDDAIAKLREKVFSSANHNRVLDSVIGGALGDYGGAKAILFIQWLWCQWLQYACLGNVAREGVEAPREVFKKRYRLRTDVSQQALPTGP